MCSWTRCILLIVLSTIALSFLSFYHSPKLFAIEKFEKSMISINETKKMQGQPAFSSYNNFSEIVNLTNDTALSAYPQIATYGKDIYVVYQESSTNTSPKRSEIFLKKSNDGGRTFSEKLNLSGNIETSEQPQITLGDNSHVYVTWQCQDQHQRYVCFNYSEDGANIFEGVRRLGVAVNFSSYPEIAAYKNHVYVVWEEYGYNFGSSNSSGRGIYSNILLRASNDFGTTFAKPIVLDNDASRHFYPKIAVSNSNIVYVVWNNVDSTQNKNRIKLDPYSGILYMTKSFDGGRTFTTKTQVTNHETGFVEPDMLASSDSGLHSYSESDFLPGGSNIENEKEKDKLLVAWTSASYSQNLNSSKADGIYFTKSLNSGTSFDPPNFLHENFNRSRNVDIASTNSELFLVWQASINGNGQIIFQEYNLNNQIAGHPIVLSNSSGLSECPSIAISRLNSTTNIYVVWEDDINGNHEILFRSKRI